MERSQATKLIKEAKLSRHLSWEEIATHVGGHPVWVTSALLGQNSMTAEQAAKAVEILALSPEVAEALQQCHMKGTDTIVPTDPLIYRFYEIMQVYGGTIKEIIHEKFGDGIMSAIDFTMDIQKEENPHGDRVVVTLNGKFLPYKKW